MTDVHAGDDGDPPLPWGDHLGPFYDTAAVRSLLGPEGQPVAVEAVRAAKGLMALPTEIGKVVYPAFQFRAGNWPPA